MKASTANTLVEPVSNRRQPIRQTRMNLSRSLNGARTLTSPDERPKPALGFFPGITHFTDSITALPKEMIRHYTMLKEVDAKIYGPDEALKKLIPVTLSRPVAHDSDADIERRQQFLQARCLMNDMLGSLDEKNHVMATANDALEKLLARCDSSWPQIEQEISEEARWGNLNHWAYKPDKTVEKKGTTTTERTRREVALANNLATAAAAAADAEVAASSRIDSRNKSSRKTQAQFPNDSDFEDGRGGRKNGGPGKRSKPADVSTLNGTGLGITNGTSNGNKRRRIDKPPMSGTIGGLPMEKSLSTVFGYSARGGGSPRETPVAEPPRKRGRGGTVTGNATGRRRAGTVTSAANSPVIASSPIVSTFSVPGKGANSPALGTAMQRTSSTRARQNSTQSTTQVNKTPVITNHQMNGNGSHNGATDIEKPTTNKSMGETKVIKGEENNTEAESRTSSRANDRSFKREDSNASRPRPPSISTSTRNNGKASKTGTPVAASFPESSRPRSGRNNTSIPSLEPPIKRSHKKGAGIQAQLAAQAAAAAAAIAKAQREDDGSSLQGDEEEDLEGEPRYCYCNSVSYGEMVACDMTGCEKEWFHLECAGLTRPPTAKTKWYCNDCKKKLR